MSNILDRPPTRRRLAAFAAAVAALTTGAADAATPTSTTAADASTPTSTSATATFTDEESAPVIGDGEEWIVFQGVELGLTFIRPDGTGEHVILGPPGDQVHPDWSPDGSEIAYVQASGTESTVWITDLQGADPRPLVETFPAELADLAWENPAWSRDGTQIAMVGYENYFGETPPTRSVLVTVDVATGELTVAGELAFADGQLHSFPRWSPDGEAMVLNVDRFSGDNFAGATVDIVRRNGSGWSAPESITESGEFARVDWHPTEDLIVFGDYDIGGIESTDQPSNLYTVRPDGSELTQITTFGPGEARATQPTWTSDGRIIFAHVTGTDDADREVAIVNADGSGLTIAASAEAVGEFNRPHPRMRPIEPAATESG